MCHASEQWEKVLNNPHFSPLPEALEASFDSPLAAAVMDEIEHEWQRLFAAEQASAVDVHQELFEYILPSIAIYRTMRAHTDSALDIFRDFFTKAAND